jgi:hypothetical protein
MKSIKYAKYREFKLSHFSAILYSIERAKNNKSEYDRINIYRYITTIQVVVVVVVVVVVHHHHHQKYPSLFKKSLSGRLTRTNIQGAQSAYSKIYNFNWDPQLPLNT